MTDESKEPVETEEEDVEDRDDDPMRALLKRSLQPTPADAPDKPILAEVQRKIRQRSKGKFFSDGWSTSGQRINYALIAVLMLLVVAIAYFALGPTGLSAR